jgi:hypothetical protein
VQREKLVTIFRYITGWNYRKSKWWTDANAYWEDDYEYRYFNQEIVSITDLATNYITDNYMLTRKIIVNVLDFNSHRPIRAEDLTFQISAENLTSATACISKAIAGTLTPVFPSIPEIVPSSERSSYSRDAYVSTITRNLSPGEEILSAENKSLQFHSGPTVTLSMFGLTIQPFSKIPMHIKITAEGYHFFEVDLTLAPDDKEIEILMTDIGSKLRIDKVEPGHERASVRIKK